jgi:phosphatidylinositol 3-kinase
LDLRLTTYRVLATSTEIGLIEFVKSSAIADILKEHDSLRAYIAIHNPDPKGPGGCTMQSMQNFVKSCAGYSVITYLLGVGDRHLDNLMLTKDGKLFHIDFGYMMGRDPKISPPSIKISKEMVDCLGEFMDDYKRYCVEAYNLLRKPHGAKLEAKFAIDLDDEAAGTHFIQEIQRSMNALFDPLFERIHAVAQRMR